jgi:hypothetical protein
VSPYSTASPRSESPSPTLSRKENPRKGFSTPNTRILQQSHRSQEVRATTRRTALRADASRSGTERGVVILRHGQTSPKPGFFRGQCRQKRREALTPEK